MGYGDEIMATGMARGLRARGKRAAFGDGRRIIWSAEAHLIFKNNPNIAPPGDEGANDLVWFNHYKGARLYHAPPDGGSKWNFREDFRVQSGEIFFTEDELEFADRIVRVADLVIIEDQVKSVAPNKQWPKDRYAELYNRLIADGYTVRSFAYGVYEKNKNVYSISSPSYRHALAVLARARLYIGPEGGLHHGAAAVGTPAVVIFGGFISPNTTGYEAHTNIFVGDEACGQMKPCQHCREAMNSITTERVYNEARNRLVLS